MFNREYRHARFLIVDGNPQLRIAVDHMLKAFGAWLIDFAADSHEAISKSEAGCYDVVICDFQLPGRNGQHVLEELRERKILRHTSVFVMMSAETTLEMVLGAIDHQPDAYINKPVTTDLLKQRLDALLVENEVLYELKHALDMDRISEAISRCQEKIAKGSRYARWCEKMLAALHLRSGEYMAAMQVYEDVLAGRALLWAQVGLARVHMALGDYGKAEVLLRSVIDSTPLCLVAYDLLAETMNQQGNAKEAQLLLTKAVKYSPTAILRHAELGKISWQNLDVENSLEAYRNAVELGRHSIYDRVENHLGFARGLCERASAQAPDIRVVSAGQAQQVLHDASERFVMQDANLFQKYVIGAKALVAADDRQQASQALKQAEVIYHHSGPQMAPDLLLEYARTLLAIDQDIEAEFVLSQLTLMHGNRAEVMNSIEDIRDEPVSIAARQKAAGLNKQGIGLAEHGQLREAAKIFSEALEYSPRHPALNLNLAQVLLKILAEEPAGEQDRMACEQCFQRIEHLKPCHKQFPRLQHLKDKLQKSAACKLL